MNNDNELFELCKEVYKRTGWQGEPAENFRELPLYTSDYLLEKLPKIITDHYYLNLSPSKEHWYAAYSQYAMGKQVKFVNQGDTPLKALLKLVIALDDAKELK